MSNQDRNDPDGWFANAMIARADDPVGTIEDGNTLTFRELEICSREPLRLVVLIHWRMNERNGLPRTGPTIWARLTEQGMCGTDGQTPVRLDEVADAIDFLRCYGLVSTAEAV